jgi:hypothetical protein
MVSGTLERDVVPVFGSDGPVERQGVEVTTVGDLKSRRRARIPTRKFGLPERARSPESKKESGNYPMPDRRHAANAKARAKQQLKRKRLSRAAYDRIVAKADRILKRSKS